MSRRHEETAIEKDDLLPQLQNDDTLKEISLIGTYLSDDCILWSDA